jgi:hypothetical protein
VDIRVYTVWVFVRWLGLDDGAVPGSEVGTARDLFESEMGISRLLKVRAIILVYPINRNEMKLYSKYLRK